MKKQLLTLQQLIGVTDPELYRHLGPPIYLIHGCIPRLTPLAEKIEGLNLFFCFRYALPLRRKKKES